MGKSCREAEVGEEDGVHRHGQGLQRGRGRGGRQEYIDMGKSCREEEVGEEDEVHRHGQGLQRGSGRGGR